MRVQSVGLPTIMLGLAFALTTTSCGAAALSAAVHHRTWAGLLYRAADLSRSPGGDDVEPLPRADAVVVLAGAPGDRLPVGLELMNDGAAPVLVLSAGVDEPRGWNQIEHLCHDDHPWETRCIVPQANSTLGEAATIGRLANDEGWESLILVTSDYHMYRATRYFETCYDGEIIPVASRPDDVTAAQIRHELLGTVHAHTVGRFCPSPSSPS